MLEAQPLLQLKSACCTHHLVVEVRYELHQLLSQIGPIICRQRLFHHLHRLGRTTGEYLRALGPFHLDYDDTGRGTYVLTSPRIRGRRITAGAPLSPTCPHNPPQYIPFATPLQVLFPCPNWCLDPIEIQSDMLGALLKPSHIAA